MTFNCKRKVADPSEKVIIIIFFCDDRKGVAPKYIYALTSAITTPLLTSIQYLIQAGGHKGGVSWRVFLNNLPKQCD